jgi:uncharacterized protein (TIGR02996 family)
MATTARPKPKRTDPLLAAIIAEPNDDTARLAYADYLEEEGNPERAEFIRVQVNLARLPAWERKAKLLGFRERLLRVRNGEKWRAELPNIAGVQWGKFERGFIAEVTVADVRVLAKQAESLRAVSPITGIRLLSLDGIWAKSVKAYPWLRSLCIGPDCRTDLGAIEVFRSRLCLSLERFDCGTMWLWNDPSQNLAVWEHLAELRELDCSNAGAGDRAVAVLAGAKQIAGLRVLRLCLTNSGGYVTDPHISESGIRTLANSPHLTNLTTLDLGNQRFTDGGVRAVLGSATFTRLETVCFGGAALTPKAFEISPSSQRLRDVDFTNCLFGDAGAVALAKLPQFSHVCRLNMRACEIGAKGIAAFARSALSAHVQELNLAANPLRSSGVEELVRGRWPGLHTLNISKCGISAETAKSLQAAQGIGKLLDFDLSGNDVGAAGAIAASRAKWSGQLVRLNLAKCGCAAGAVLANAESLRAVQQLDLTDNPLNPEGVEALMQGEWPELTDLWLTETNAGDDGVRAIARSGVLSRLVTLAMNRCRITPEGLTSLFAAPNSISTAPHLLHFALNGNATGDETAHILARATLPALRFLSLDHLGLSTSALEWFISTPFFTQLVRVCSLGSQFSVPVVQAYNTVNHRAMPPDLKGEGFTPELR